MHVDFSIDSIEHIMNIYRNTDVTGGFMTLFATILFITALVAAFAAIGSSIARALPRIDAVISSRGQPVERTIRIGIPYNGWKLA
jgi:hypothetical protein